MRWPAAVKALSMAMETEVSFARGMRVKWRRCRVESTRAMLKSTMEMLVGGMSFILVWVVTIGNRLCEAGWDREM